MSLISVETLRHIPYNEGILWQKEALRSVSCAQMTGQRPVAGKVLMAEFHSVITLGRSTRASSLLASEDAVRAAGYALYHVERGGDATGHGPGQWTIYPVLPLKAMGLGVRAYVRLLEEFVIHWLKGYGLDGVRREGLTGVWLGNDKIAAVGVAITRWVSWHGVAINISRESLSWVRWVVPCGIEAGEGGVTSLSAALGREVTVDETEESLREALVKVICTGCRIGAK